MSATGLKVFDSTIQTVNIWLDDIMDDLGWKDRHKAYHALRAVLHTLRDRLTVEQGAHLAAQLPLLLRGTFYEGWRPGRTPVKERHRDQFIAHVSEAFALDMDVNDPEEVTCSVLRTLQRHVDKGAINHLQKVLPTGIRALLNPATARKSPRGRVRKAALAW